MIWKTTLAFLVTFIFLGNAFSQTFTTDKPDLRLCNPGFNCPSNNFTLDNVFISLTDINGVPLSGTTCTIGNVQQAYVLLNYTSNANNTINNTRLFGDLVIDGVSTSLNVFLGSVSGGGGQKKIYGPFNWTCGEELLLENLLIVWKTGGSSTEITSYDCNTFNKSQCEFPANTVIAAPLAVEFDFNVCTDENGVASVQYNSTTSGGIAPYTYKWDFQNDGIVDATTKNPSFNFSQTNISTKLTVTDSQNLSSSYTLIVSKTTPTVAKISGNQNLSCSNTSTVLNGSTSTGNGTLKYAWTTTNGIIDSGANTATATVSASGTYTLTVTDANGCTDTETITTTLDNTAPTAAIANNNGLALSCSVPNTTLTASGGVSYSWSDGSQVVGTNASLLVNTAGTFTVTVTGANGCTSTASATTTLDNTAPTAAIANNNGLALSCSVPNTTLTASGGVSYSWSNGSQVVGTNASLLVNTAGTFTVTVTGANGCTSTASATTTLDNTAPTAAIANNNGLALSCSVPNTTLTASGGVSYSWSNGSEVVGTSASLLVNTAGTFTVTVTGANGCTSTASATTTLDNTAPTAAIANNNGLALSCSVPNTTLTASGGVSYSWSNGSQVVGTSASLLVNTAGTFTVTVTGANGCTSTASATTTLDNTAPTAAIANNNGLALSCSVPNTTLTASGGVSYSWSNGSEVVGTSASLLVNTAGTFTVTVTGANGCTSTASATTTLDNTAPTAAIANNNGLALSCSVPNTTLTASGGVSYSWSNGSQVVGTSASLLVNTAGTFTVTVTGANGCTSTASATTTLDNTAPTAAIINNNGLALSCSVPNTTLTASGGVSYSWSDGSQVVGTSASLLVNTAGTFTVTVTGANGCNSTASVSVEKNTTTANAVITGNEVLTCANTSVTLDASTSTADGEFTYEWSNGSTEASIIVTEPGNYSVTITGANDCSDSTSVTVEQNITTANAVITGNEVLTCATTSVTLDASSSTADGDFTYEWSNGSTEASITVTDPGSYSVTITGANGCFDSASVTVEQNITTANAVITGNEILTCDVTSVTLDASTSTADGDFTYEWSNGSTESSITVTDPGTYSVTITGANGCFDSASVTVEQNDTTASAVITGNEVLTCATTSVTLDASTSTADGDYTYEWSNGSTEASIIITDPGNYSVTITGANGCSDSASVTVEQNITTANAVITGNEVLTCATTSVTLDASSSTADGDFTYEWSNGSTEASIIVTEPGNYSVTITGANGCLDTASVTVEQNITTANAVITGNEILTCDVTSVTLDASTSTADGDFTYEWSNGSTESSITVTDPGTYSVTITGANGCFDSDSVTVEQNDTTASAVITGNEVLTCATTSVTLDASTSTADGDFTYEWSNGSTEASIIITDPGNYSVTITGANGCSDSASLTVEQNITTANAVITGNEILTCDVTSVTLDASTSTADGDFTYEWSNGSTESSITVTDPGTYSVTITGANGCFDSDSVTVEQNDTTASAVITGNEVLTCATTSVTLDASTSTADGDFTYEWSNGSTESSITVTDPGTYSVTITGANGCFDSDSVTVEQNDTTASAVITGNEVLTCATTSVTLDASTSTADGDFTYEWSNGSTEASIIITDPGNYSVTITGANGCLDTASVTVEQNITTANAVIAGNETLTCDVTSVTLDASTSTADGDFDYEWSNGSTEASITVTEPGNYSVTITGANGCSDSTSVTVEQNITTANAVIAGNEVITCNTTSVTLDASTSTADGDFTYEWSNGSTESSITVTDPGTYSVTITGANGCFDSDSVTVEQNDTTASAVITGNEVLTCATTSVTLDASTSTADGDFTYEWSNGSTESSITVTDPGNYSVTITGANGCSDSASVTVEQNITTANAVITGNEVLTCATTSVTLDASSSTADGDFAYEWSNGSTESSISVTEQGNYSVTITGANGCADTASVTVEQNITTANAVITGNEILTCDVTSVTLDASTSTADGDFTYEWSNGSTESSITVTDPGTYSVTITGANGCFDSDSVTVEQNDTTASAVITGNEVLTCATTSVTLDASTSTADGDFTYEWSNGSTESSITVTDPGNYSVTITGANGCSDSASVTVEQNITTANAVITGNEVLTCATTSVTLDASSSTADGDFAYEWSNGSTEASIIVTEQGNYSVTITGANGCADTASVTVEQNITTANAVITGNEVLTCDVTSVTLDASSSSADGDFIYEWSNGSTESSITVTDPGTYSVTITGANGCSDEASVEVKQNITAANADISGNEVITCNTPSVTLDASSSTADGDFTYEWSNGSTESSITVTDPGNYSVTITGANGCSDSTSVTVVTDLETPAAVTYTTVQPTCTVSTGSFSIAAVEGLEYSINGGAYAATTTFEGLSAGTYTVRAKGENGCVSEATSVTINAQPVTPSTPVVASTTQPACDVATGSFSVTAVDGLEYSINGGAYAATTTFANLSAGTYTVTARNADGCVSEAVSVTINAQPATPAIPVVASTTQPTCDVATGSFSITAVEGLQYSLNGGAYAATTSFESLSAGTYTVTARNSGGCVSSAATIEIEEVGSAEPIQTDTVDLCTEDDTFDLFELLQGDFNINGTWEDPGQTGALTGSMIDPALLEVGNYTFNYVIGGGCPSTTVVAVSINDDCIPLDCSVEDIKSSISKAVTPNGDGHNDYFKVNLDLECGFTYNVKMFNRWGNEVFSANNYQNNWDGQSNKSATSSNQLPAGTYYYILEINGSGFQPIQGYIYLGTK